MTRLTHLTSATLLLFGIALMGIAMRLDNKDRDSIPPHYLSTLRGTDTVFAPAGMAECEESGVSSASIAYGTTFYASSACPTAGEGAPCARCTTNHSAAYGTGGSPVPPGTGDWMDWDNCGLALKGTCTEVLIGGQYVPTCANMTYVYNQGGSSPVGCSAIPHMKSQANEG